MIGELVGQLGVDELRQRGQVPARLVGEPATDHHRLQVDVQSGGDHGLVAAGHHDQFVDELVVGAAPVADLGAQRPLLGLGHLLHDQNLEIELFARIERLILQPTRVGRKHVLVIEAGVVDVAGAVGLGGQRTVDPGDRRGELLVVARGEQPLDLGELRGPGKRPVRLQRRQIAQQPPADLHIGVFERATRARSGQPVGRLLQSAPGVGPQLPGTVVRARILCHGRPSSRWFRLKPGRGNSSRGRRES